MTAALNPSKLLTTRHLARCARIGAVLAFTAGMKFVASVLNEHIAQPLSRLLPGAPADSGTTARQTSSRYLPTLTGDDDSPRTSAPRVVVACLDGGVTSGSFGAATNVDIVSPCFVEVLP